jgi:hypothetical protein
MSDDIKKLLSILSESTTAGSIATTAGTTGNSMLKRPTDTIFAAENTEPSEPAPNSPANFGLWKNSAVIGKEQYGKHGRKKAKVDKTQIYPQLNELSPQTLASYKKKAGADATAADSKGDFAKGHKRFKGIVKATKKEFDNDARGIKEGVELDPSEFHSVRNGDITPEDLAKKKGVSVGMLKGELNLHADHWAQGENHYNDLFSGRREVSEISQGLRDRYVEKATSDYGHANFSARASKSHPGLEDYSKEQSSRAKKRAKGLSRALSDKRLGREEVNEDGSDNPVASAITRRIMSQRMDLVVDFGVEAVVNAIDEVASWAVVFDEIGTSDVSGWVRQVESYLKGSSGKGLSENKNKLTQTTPRNFVAKHAKTAGAGAHKDMKRAVKQGDVKHKNRQYDLGEGTSQQNVEEGWKEKLGAAALAGSLAFGASSAQAQPSTKQVSAKPVATQQASAKSDPFTLNGKTMRDDVRSAIMKMSDDDGQRAYAAWRVLVSDSNSQKQMQAGQVLNKLMQKYSMNEQDMSEGTWDGTGEQDVAAAIASNGIDNQDAATEKQISLSEEMIADRLKNELALFKSGTKPKNKDISKKPADREVQSKKPRAGHDDKTDKKQAKKS